MTTTPRTVRARARRAWAGDRERGLITTEFAVVFPTVIILTLLIVQAGLWYLARQSALAAAREGVQTAITYDGGGPDAGVTRARETVRNVGGGVLTNPSVSPAGSTPERVRIEVKGECVSLLPGITCTVAQHVEAPVERWTDPLP